MQSAPTLEVELQVLTAEKPTLVSYDSSTECSLDHWLEVYWLVEEDYLFAKASDSEVPISH